MVFIFLLFVLEYTITGFVLPGVFGIMSFLRSKRLWIFLFVLFFVIVGLISNQFSNINQPIPNRKKITKSSYYLRNIVSLPSADDYKRNQDVLSNNLRKEKKVGVDELV